MTTGTPITDDELAAIEARANAASPGPWNYIDMSDEYEPDNDGDIPCEVTGPLMLDVADGDYALYSMADAEFIAASCVDVPALVAEVRRLRAECATWEQRAFEAHKAITEEHQ